LGAERELAVRFGVSRETARQALHELLVEGRIERRGRGTVVSQPKLIQPLSLRSYTEGAAERGRIPGRLPVTWEDVETALPSPREAELLGTTTAMPALLLNRRTLTDR
jgi:GntR family transcriptional regulator